MSVEMPQDLHDDRVLGDKCEDLHLAPALGTCQRVYFVDAVNELGPTSVESASSRRRLGVVPRAHEALVGSSHAIRIGAIEMDEVLFGLWDMDEDSRQKLEYIDTLAFGMGEQTQ